MTTWEVPPYEPIAVTSERPARVSATAQAHGASNATTSPRPTPEASTATGRPLGKVAVSDPVAGLLNTAPDGLLIVDADGRILLANTQLEELFGYGPTELTGQCIEVLMPERVRGTHTAQRAAFAASPRTRPMGLGFHLVGRRRSGAEFPVEISLRPLTTGDGQWVAAVVRDETARLEAERQRETAVADEDTRIAADLGDTVIRGLFGTGLRLYSLLPKTSDPVRNELLAMIGEIDSVIREIRDVIFALAPTHSEPTRNGARSNR